MFARVLNIRLAVVMLLLILTACESPGQRDGDGLRNIIPTAEPDRAPARPKDVSGVPDAVPRLEQRTLAGNKSPYKVKGIVYRVMDSPDGYEAYGIASWYGEKFHGNHTSNGEIYDMYQMTAAHKTLPIPSYVRVTNVENGKSVIVRVNDRGPFARGRIIDLSYAGAKKLDYIESGTAKVKVEYIDPLVFHAKKGELNEAKVPRPISDLPHAAASQRFLQIGAFSTESAARAMQQRVAAYTSIPVVIQRAEITSSSVIYRVHVGPFLDEQIQESTKSLLMSKGLDEPLAVVR